MPKRGDLIESVDDFGGRLLASGTEVARLLGVDRAIVTDAMAAGQIPVMRLGRSNYVPVAWLRQLASGSQEVISDPPVPSVNRRDADRNAVFAHYGETCACCGGAESLTIDHVNGDGARHRQELFGDSSNFSHDTYRWLIENDFPEGFQTLCKSCNASKGGGERCRLNHAPAA